MNHILITGVAGFIGSHTAYRYLDKGWRVTVFDNLSRRGSEHNLNRLRSHPNAAHLTFIRGDVRDTDALLHAVTGTDAILHAAGQTAVTTSMADPVILYTSTNKVYGAMEDVRIALRDDHYQYVEFPDGMTETQPLDFHSPNGCSKGAGDQYIRDYARIYDLKTVVFRQSCIYGTWQFGVEDQGWVAFFAIASLLDFPLTIYGDGKQVRDVLYIDDLVALYERAIDEGELVAGEVFNVGGGPANAISLLDLLELLAELHGRPVDYSFSTWRPGDQRVYVSDTRKAAQRLGWQPAVSMRDGITRMVHWMAGNMPLLHAVREAAHG
ncbi:MAG: GDP-mannose 4,6-dehydratase [Anaerolineae bacterium]